MEYGRGMTKKQKSASVSGFTDEVLACAADHIIVLVVKMNMKASNGKDVAKIA